MAAPSMKGAQQLAKAGEPQGQDVGDMGSIIYQISVGNGTEVGYERLTNPHCWVAPARRTIVRTSPSRLDLENFF